MNRFKIALGSGFCAAVVLFFSSMNLTSCTKETTVHEVTVTIRDTITKTDTLVQVDTICKLEVGLIAHYNFTDGSLLDETDNHNDITFNNATPVADINGEANNAYKFDGSTSYMRVPNSTSLNPQNITMMARIRVDGFYQGTCHFSDIISKGATDYVDGFYVLRIADPFGHCFELPDETREFFVGGFGNNTTPGDASGVAADTSFIQKNQWYTVVYTFDGSTSKMYVNGQLKAELARSTSFTANNSNLFIGRHEDQQFPYWFNGVIDEIRIYDRAVNKKEAAVLSIY
jgi:hypothetical protein